MILQLHLLKVSTVLSSLLMIRVINIILYETISPQMTVDLSLGQQCWTMG